MSRSTYATALASVAAAIGLTVAFAAPSSARTEVDKYDWPMGRVYDNQIAPPSSGVSALEEDLVVITGGTAPDFCTSLDGDPANDVPPELAMEIDRSVDGVTIHERLVSQRTTVEVYDGGGLDVFAWALAEYCPALWDDDPATTPPSPVATGVGNLQEKAVVDVSAFPVVTIDSANQLRATLTAAGGARWVVHADAVSELYLEIDPATGVPVVFVENPQAVSVHVLNR